MTEKKKPAKKTCLACEQPDRHTRHSCGLKGLQDLFSFGPRTRR